VPFQPFPYGFFRAPSVYIRWLELANKDQIVLCTMGNSVADVVSSVAEFREC